VTRTRLGGLVLLLLSSGIFIVWGSLLDRDSPERSLVSGMRDFKILYGAMSCLLQHDAPYTQSGMERYYRSEGWEIPNDPVKYQGATVYVYFPTASIFVAPFAMLPWGPAHLLWMSLIAASLTIAAFLMWNVAADYSRGVSLFLICMLLANCEVLFERGNSAGIVISLCVVCILCFFREWFVAVGVL